MIWHGFANRFRLTCSLLLFFLSFTLCQKTTAQPINQPVNNPEWEVPYKPFRIVGNLYYVGTSELASFLIVTEKGNILINTGLANSLPQLKLNIEELGFAYKDIKILLTNQVHYDHVGAMAAIKKETGARFFVNSADADVLKSGGMTDYELANLGMSFSPIEPDRLLKNNDKIKLGKTTLRMLHHPGHTKGSCSYLINVIDSGKTFVVLIANIPTIIIDRKFPEVKEYPTIQKDYANTFRAMKNLSFDIWLAAHASQFNLHQIRNQGDSYNPGVFLNKSAYRKQIEINETVFNRKILE
ncbi:MAG: subclass B3 metallo-beta-lactamase [Niabella sp.]|nr:MAG: subclass B3 metallo-beta-lactamase [Niabella sp.]